MAFLTSRYTLDRKDAKVREYLAKRAGLLGAVCLPNTHFKAIAGTKVMSGIISLHKRETSAVGTSSWVQTRETPLGLRINQYFLSLLINAAI